MDFLMKKKCKGFTLIEFMVVIALIAIGLLFIVNQFKDASDQNKAQTAVKNSSQLISAISSFKGVRSGYTGITESVIIKSSQVPDILKVSGVLTNIYGGTITVTSASAAPWLNNYVEILYNGLDSKACVDFSSKLIPVSFVTNTSTFGVEVQTGGVGAFKLTTSLSLAIANCVGTGNVVKIRSL